MENRERVYIFLIGILFANLALTGALLSGYLAKPSWIVPADAMVVAKDFIEVMKERNK